MASYCLTEPDAGSDAVFQENHIDGPFGLFPKLTLVRCIVTLNNETNIITNIKGKDISCNKGDFFAIDYNRDLHFIYGEQLPEQKRYILKLHYVMYPKNTPMPILKFYKYINYKYNLLARKLFLYTINPTSYKQQLANWVVNTTTKLSAKSVSIISNLKIK